MSALLPSEVLSRAADLIEPEGAWTQHASARNAQGMKVQSYESEAACWCAVGAIWTQQVSIETENAAVGFFGAAAGGTVAFNDAPDRTQAEVVAALRKASELAKAEGQ